MVWWVNVFVDAFVEGFYSDALYVKVSGLFPERVCPGPVCGHRELATDEVYPPFVLDGKIRGYRQARHLCDDCYRELFHRTNDRCLVCGRPISELVDFQRKYWGDPLFHLCQNDACPAMWALIRACVIGYPKLFFEMRREAFYWRLRQGWTEDICVG